MQRKGIVITGASSGIGAALAEILGRADAHLVLLARREEELAQVASRSDKDALPIAAARHAGRAGAFRHPL